MKSISFPNIFNKSKISVSTVSDYDTTLQNLKLLILSEKGELFGDPYYGTGLRKYMFDQNDVILQDLLIDDIYSAISLFMPQIKVERKDIIISKADSSGDSYHGKLFITIKATNKASFSTDLYKIVLTEAEV